MTSKFDDADRLTDDKRTVFTLQTFCNCHDVDWLIAKRLPTFAILIRYLRGWLEATAENVMTLCDVVDYLRSCKDMSISTSILHVGRNSGAFRMDGNGCGFEFCFVCNSSPVPQKEDEKGRPNIERWLFATEEWLVQGLIEKIMEEEEEDGSSWVGALLRGERINADSVHAGLAREVAMRNTVMMSLARRREESAEQFHTIEAPRFKVTIKGGVVTDVWHRDDQRLPRSSTSLEDRTSALTQVWFLWPQPWYKSVHKCMCDKAVQADGANSRAVYTLHKCKGDKGVQTDEVVTVTHDVQ